MQRGSDDVFCRSRGRRGRPFHQHCHWLPAVNPELSTGWVRLGRVGLGRDFAVFDGLGWVEYDESTIFFDDYTTYNCKGPCKLNTREYEKLAFFDQYLTLFRKRYKIRP